MAYLGSQRPSPQPFLQSLRPMARGKFGRAVCLAVHRCLGIGMEIGKATPNDVRQQAYGGGDDADDGLIGCFSKPSSDPCAHRIVPVPKAAQDSDRQVKA